VGRFAASLRLSFVGAIVAATVALIAAAPASADGGGYACVHHGDKRPGTITTKQARNAVICLINKARRDNGRGGLDGDSRLNESARKHSKRMARGCFSHECPGENGLEGRLKSVGYLVGGLRRWAYGENIAYGSGGQGTPREIVKAWMHSSGHRANILSRTFEDVGAGFARNGDRGYYTADFGLRQG
jgi:uncharacterized protein YkwD